MSNTKFVVRKLIESITVLKVRGQCPSSSRWNVDGLRENFRIVKCTLCILLEMFRQTTRRGRGVATVGSEEGKLMRCRIFRICA